MPATTDSPDPAPAAAPAPLSHGTYALYETPGGGRHLVAQPVDQAEPLRFDIPATVLKMAQQAAAGKGLPGLGALTGMFRGGRS